MDQILALTPQPGESYRTLEWADDKLDQPVFPEWSAEGPKDKPKSPNSWGTQASAWAVPAGFPEGMGLHASRREALIKVDGTCLPFIDSVSLINAAALDSGYSMGQVMKFAAHRNPRTLVQPPFLLLHPGHLPNPVISTTITGAFQPYQRR